MAKIIAGTTMSLDGYMSDPNGNIAPLYPDFEEFTSSEHLNEIIEQTGAVIMGRRTFEMGDADLWMDYEFQVPIFVVTSSAPAEAPKHRAPLSFTFVTDGVVAAADLAKDAAGERDVQVVGGASVIRQLLSAGLVDELHIDVMPVVLGGGLRLLDDVDPARVRLEKRRVAELGERTALEFRVARG